MPDDPAPEDEAPALAVFDLDGTLTDTRHRLHHIEDRPRRWVAFFAAAGRDGTHPEGLAALRTAAGAGCGIVYLSGRPERLRQVTEQWLRRHDCPDGPLLLRADRDFTSAVDFKLRALRSLAATSRLVLLVDDDPDVVAAVRQRPGLVAQVVLADWQPRELSTPFEHR